MRNDNSKFRNGELVYKHKMKRQHIKVVVGKKRLSSEEEREQRKLLRKIMFITCVFLNVGPRYLRTVRKTDAVIAKQIYAYIAHRYSKATLKMIGELMGNEYTHGAVHSSIKKAIMWLDTPSEVDFRLNLQIIEFKFKTLCLKN